MTKKSRVLLRSALQAAGYDVVEATNGRIGLDLYRLKPTDLVITDIAMPELNGLDLILALTRQFLHAKVIAISGAGGEKNVLDVETARSTADLSQALEHTAVAGCCALRIGTLEPPFEPRIEVPEAVMRWSRGQEFAVENLAMEPHAVARLARYVTRTVQEPSESILRVRTAPS